jgi:protein PhnA
MTYSPCREGTLEETLNHPGHWEYSIYCHRPEAPEPEAMRVGKVAHGNSLPEGDTVTLVKDPKLGGGSQILKAGTKAKNIRPVDGDHQPACKIEGSPMALKTCFVRQANRT